MPLREHAPQGPRRADQMLLADNIIEHLRAQPVRERARRAFIHARGFEKTAHGRCLARFRHGLTVAWAVQEPACDNLQSSVSHNAIATHSQKWQFNALLVPDAESRKESGLR